MTIIFDSSYDFETLSKLGYGAEASVYEYNQKALKIFKESTDLNQKMKKIEIIFDRVVTKLVDVSSIIYPEERVMQGDKYVGYSMKLLKDNYHLYNLVNEKFLKQHEFTNKDILEIIIKMLSDIEKVHAAGCIIGDINCYNFYVEQKNNYFVDIDSWGIDQEYQPDMYTTVFIDPTSFKDYNYIEFTVEHEYYALAVMIFFILTGIHPFGSVNESDEIHTIKRMRRKASILGEKKDRPLIEKANWKWMSPQLLDTFLEIFENDKRVDLLPQLNDIVLNLKYCEVHNKYYSNEYDECPLCKDNI